MCILDFDFTSVLKCLIRLAVKSRTSPFSIRPVGVQIKVLSIFSESIDWTQIPARSPAEIVLTLFLKDWIDLIFLEIKESLNSII